MTEPPKQRVDSAPAQGERSVVLLHHATRPDALSASQVLREGLEAAGVTVQALSPALEIENLRSVDVEGAELVVVLGGDGSILTGIELARPFDVPVLGVNLGHVGFLAEAEPEALPTVVRRIVDRDYLVEERMTLDVAVHTPDGVTHTSWALNEAVVEKGPEGRMVDAAIGVDGRGLSTFACDAVVLATPTGSTAYAFSGGGPVVWPGVEALLLVPIAAHALFTRPMVVGKKSVLEVEILAEARAGAVVRCDGRRTIEVPPGSHIEARRGTTPARLALLSDAPFSGRLVAKFDLPVSGWRGRPGSSRRIGTALAVPPGRTVGGPGETGEDRPVDGVAPAAAPGSPEQVGPVDGLGPVDDSRSGAASGAGEAGGPA